MGCTTSRINDLPAVSLCHDRCKFLEEALHQSYALADAHLAYMQSLKSIGPTLHRFFYHDLNHSDSQLKTDRPVINLNPLKSSSSLSPDPCPSSSNSESHLDFRSDSEDDEFVRDKDFDILHRIHPNYFYHDQNKYDYYTNNSEQLFRVPSPFVTSPPIGGGSAWKTPSPPAPGNSTWDFLNFFDAYERYELPMKDKEEIHEIHADEKFGRICENLKGEENGSRAKLKAGNDDVKQPDVTVAEMNVVSEKEQNKERNDSSESNNRIGLEVMREVQLLFERAAESGNEVLKIFDTGKFRYYCKNSVYQGISSKMLQAVTPSFLVQPCKNTGSLSAIENIDSIHKGFDEDLAVISVNLSSTLNKLCMWEKKLYDEVKAEEKLCIIHAKNYRQVRSLGEKGAGPNKVDSTRTLLRMLSTKIKVAIHVIDRTSININKLRDEELWPQIGELIQKLLGMWKEMLECHKCQSQALLEARNLDAIVANAKFSDDAHFEAAIQLKIKLQNWNLSFSNWITAQRGFVKALNSWLLRCLPHEPEEMPDGAPPFSPGRVGEPPLFAFCNQWLHAMDRISEMEVIEAINGFFTSVTLHLERHNAYLQQRLIADKDMEKKMKILEREEQRIQKVMQGRQKNTFLTARDASGALLSRGVVRPHEMTVNNSLQLGMLQIFKAIEQFSANSIQAYEELHVFIVEGRLTQENPEGS